MFKTVTWKDDYAIPYKDLTPSQKLITEIRQAIVVWERWLAENRDLLSESQIEFHEQSMRYVKFLVKLWRIRLAGQPQTKQISIHGASAQ